MHLSFSLWDNDAVCILLGESKTVTAEAAASEAVATPMEAGEAASASEPTDMMKSVLSKITEKESLIPASVIPDGSKVISSLFGRLSKFAVAPSNDEDEARINISII